MKKVLVHTCCAPCFCYIHEDLTSLRQVYEKGEELDITSYYYNPNIQPKFEFERRKKTLIDFCNLKNCKLVTDDTYNLYDFAKASTNLDKNKYSCRCEYCYTLRLQKAFEYASENNFDEIMTTLSISPYQKQDIIKKVGEKLSKEYGVKYVHLDYTPHFREGQNMAREFGLYRQKYCGCMFSIDEGIVNEKTWV